MKFFKSSVGLSSRLLVGLAALFMLAAALGCGGGGGSGENRETSREHQGQEGCDLEIEKRLRGEELSPGDTAVFVLQITNVGDRPCRGDLEVEDLLPPGIHFDSAVASPDWNCTGDGQDPETVTCANPGITLGPGDSTTLNLQVRVGERAACTLGNTASVSISEHEPGGDQPGDGRPGPPVELPDRGGPPVRKNPDGGENREPVRSASRNHGGGGGRPSFHHDIDLSNNTDHTDFEVNGRLDCIDPPPGMVGWWSADLHAQDISGLSNHGTPVDDATYNSGYVQHSFDFDNSDDTAPSGESDHVAVSDDSTLNFGENSFSIDAWVRPAERKEIQPIVFKTGTSPDGVDAGYAFWVQGDELNLEIRGGGGNELASGGTVPTGQWTHVTGVVDRQSDPEIRLYVNGSQVAATPIDEVGSVDNSEDLFIGRTGAGSWIFDRTLYFHGQIDEVEIFRRTIEQDEIEEIVEARTCGKCKEDPGDPGFKCEDESDAVQPPPGMVSWWTLDETSGNTSFDYQDGNDGSHVNGPAPFTGQVDGGLRFVGNGEHVNVPDDSSLDFGSGSYTIDAWINHTQQRDIFPIADKWQTGPTGVGQGYRLFSNVFGDITFRVGDGTTNTTVSTSGGPATPGQWNHVAAVWDRGDAEARIFVNGTLEATQSIPSSFGSVANTSDLHFARRDSIYYIGILDEIEFFDRALDQSEIQSIYNAQEHGKCKDDLDEPDPGFECEDDPDAIEPPSGMVGWWSGDQTAGDYSPEDNHGSLTGGAGYSPAYVDRSFEFSGSAGEHVSVPDDPSLDLANLPAAAPTNMTVDAWINPDTLTANGDDPIVDKRDFPPDRGGYYFFLENNGRLKLQLTDISGNYQVFSAGGPPLPTNQWTHVAATVEIDPTNATTVEFFVNGSSAGTQTEPVTFTTANQAPLWIGESKFEIGPGSAPQQFDGEIDEVELFDRVLPQSEIQSIAGAERHGKCKDDVDGGQDPGNGFACEDNPEAVEPPQSMVAWWTLDGNSGPSEDIRGFNNEATWFDDPAPLSGEYVDSSLSFDVTDDTSPSGEKDYLRVDDHSELDFGSNSFTIDNWVKPTGKDTFSNRWPIVTKLELTNGIPNIQFTGYSTYLTESSNSSGFHYEADIQSGPVPASVSTGPVVPSNQWSHVATVVDQSNNEVRQYVNGSLEATEPFTSSQIDDVTNSADLLIGRSISVFAPPQYHSGALDEIELFDRALEQSEIQSLYAAQRDGKCKDPLPITEPIEDPREPAG